MNQLYCKGVTVGTILETFQNILSYPGIGHLQYDLKKKYKIETGKGGLFSPFKTKFFDLLDLVKIL